MKNRILVCLMAVFFVAACEESPTEVPVEDVQSLGISLGDQLHNNTLLFTSGDGNVDAWAPIFPTAISHWPDNCTANPAVALNDPDWGTAQPAYVFGENTASFQSSVTWKAKWINAWNNIVSQGNSGQSWTKYSTSVSGSGEFVLQLLADNCSWVYLDGNLVGVQGTSISDATTTYPVTLSGDHDLDFIIWDGGGQAGGMFRLETNTGQTFSDTDGDGLADISEINVHGTDPNDSDSDDDGLSDGEEIDLGTDPNDSDSDDDGAPDGTDVEPNRTNHYAWVDWQSADIAGGTAYGIATLANGTVVDVNLRVVGPNGAAPIFGFTNNGTNFGGISGFSFHDWFSHTPATYTSSYVLNHPGFDDDIIGLGGGTDHGDPLSSYIITFSQPVADPAMAIMSLGASGNAAVYAFDRSFEILSGGPGRFGGGGLGTGWTPETPVSQRSGEPLSANEGNGSIRFLGSFDTFSFTVPDGEVWHGFTIGIRGLADANVDSDGDGVPDAADNCPAVANSGQGDSDGDGIGDLCDSADDGDKDTDGDGLTNAQEVGIGTSPTNPDTDGDGVNDGDDYCPLNPACSSNPDSDGDGVPDSEDDFPNDPTETTDSDGDGVGDNSDNCVDVANTGQADNDGDGAGDACDPDDDDDGVSDVDEIANGTDPFDADSDDDGFSDGEDVFPNDPTEWADNDNDGTGDNADLDDDNDGQSDVDEATCGSDPLDAGSTSPDNDGDGSPDCVDADDDNDGLTDAEEVILGTDPFNPDTDGDGVGDAEDSFPLSDLSATVAVDGCDSGVANQLLDDGATMNDLIAAARADAKNHGQFMRAVADLTDSWKKAGLISGRDQGAIVSCNAQTNGKKKGR